MNESDWKVFKKIKEKALEKYCLDAMADFSEIIKNEKSGAHDRYLEFYQLVRKRDKELGKIFDGHSRSKATMQLLLIRMEGLVDEELLQKLSDEFLQDTDPKRLT